MNNNRLKKAAGMLVALTIVGALHARAGNTLLFNGKTASDDVREIGGTPYVKLSDMAKALGMVVVKKSGGYELIKAGRREPSRGNDRQNRRYAFRRTVAVLRSRHEHGGFLHAQVAG